MKNISFLLGAGASIPAGYSSTKRLTKKIMAPRGYTRHTAGYYIADPDNQKNDLTYTTPVVRRIIRWLFMRTQEYFLYDEEPKEPNYEDLYYLASQLRDDATELENPAVLPLIRKLKCEMTLWSEYEKFCEQYLQWDKFNHLCEETCHYIEDIVAHMLNRRNECCTKHLEIIKSISEAEGEGLELKGIATLAHDTHVERYLRCAGIKYTDGFSVPIPDDPLRIWRDHFSPDDGIPFLKLHGSVDWIRFDLRKPGENQTLPLSEIGVCESPRLDNSIYGKDKYADHRPLLLIGTFNKTARYSWRLMVDIHYRFRKTLEDSDTLVICGYSFGDKAINSQLISWRDAVRSRSLVVLDRRGRSEVGQSARYAATKLLNDQETTEFIAKPMEAVSTDELHRVLRSL